MDSYNFPKRRSWEVDSVERSYLPTIFIKASLDSGLGSIDDSTEVVVESDTLHAGWVRFYKGYEFDTVKQQYYKTIEYGAIWTDRTTYTGRYQTNGIDHTYILFSARFNNKDLELNKMILAIITNNEKILRYYNVQQLIDNISI